MAGHSQFSNIKYRKIAQDIKRSQRFTKLIREITVAVKRCGSDPELNPRLRSAILAARKENLPKDRIELAIKNATSDSGISENYDEVQYGGYGPFGTALIIKVLTNNRNRIASEVRYIFSRNGGNFGEIRSVSYLFNHVGLIVYKAENVQSEDLLDYGIELEVLNIEEMNVEKSRGEDLCVITCKVEDFGRVRDGFYVKFGEPELSRLSWQPKNRIEVRDKGVISRLSLLIAELESNTDVQYVESNFTFIGYPPFRV